MRDLTLSGVLAAALLAACPASPALAQAAQDTRAALDAVVERAAAGGFSGVVLVGSAGAAGDSVLYERAVGMADREAGRPMRADGVWRWASVTKQVTAALVMQEVDSGRIALDAPVTRYLPTFGGPTGGQVTVGHLLRHTSGLPNPNDTPKDPDGVPVFYRARGPVGNAAAAGAFCARAPKRGPGGGFEYNNCDYLVLGAILERVTGRGYAELVRERLGLASVGPVVGMGPEGVTGYAEGRREPAFHLETFGAGGELGGTARDLLAFDGALLRNRLVSERGTAEMWRGDPALGYVALGAWSFPARLAGCAQAVHLVERRGAISGVQVRNVIAPRLGRALIVFTNDGDVDFGEIWRGAGLSHDLLSAAFCPGAR